jgi:hypothetical protein
MATPQQTPDKPVVFLLNLENDELFDMIYPDLINSLYDKYEAQRISTVVPAKRYLSDPTNRPVAIFLPDPALAKKKNGPILEQVMNYVKAGGVAIFAATFSSFITPPNMDKFWNTWGLNWKFGDYHRTDVFLNRYEHDMSSPDVS